jgi:ATP-binding cassette, subfamily B, bacterial
MAYLTATGGPCDLGHEKFIRTRESMVWYKRYLPILKQHKPLTLLVCIYSIGAIAFQVMIPALLGGAIDSLNESYKKGNADHLNTALIIFLVAGFFRGLMNYLVRYSLFKLTIEIECTLRLLIYKHISLLPMSFFNKTPVGQLVSRATSDVRSIQQFFLYFPYIVMLIMTFVVSVIYMVFINVNLTLLAIGCLPIILMLGLNLRKVMFPLTWLVHARAADIATIVDENINGVAVYKSFAKEEEQIHRFRQSALKLRWVNRLMAAQRAKLTPFIENVAVLSQVTVLFYGGILVIEERMLLGDLVAFNFYILLMLVPFRTLGTVLINARKASAATHRICELLNTPQDIRDDINFRVPPESINCIKIDGLYYRESKTDDDQSGALLNNLNFTFNAGELYAISGPTGAGKTILVSIFAGLCKQNAGHIFLNGIDSREISNDIIKREISVVFQDGFLFADTIKNNISVGKKDASMNEIIAAAKIACAHEFIVGLDNGYDTIVGESGATLSGGQRQRINIAQALIRNGSVLILDDATSALDNKTEKMILENIKNICKGKIVILVTHRSTALKESGTVIFLESGCIKTVGRHDDLLEQHAWYRDYFKHTHGLARALTSSVSNNLQDKSPRILDIKDVSLGEAL